MEILVTGGAGFIGSNFIRYYLAKHPTDTITNLDKLTYAGNLDNLCDVEPMPSYRFVRGDIGDTNLLESLMDAGVDAVVHFAAETHVDRSISDAREFVRTNVLGTHTLMDTARRNHIRRFLYVSTDEVYGSLEPNERADENAPLKPNSPYAASKAAADLLARSYWRTHRFPAIITRCSNNYGPNQFPEKLIPVIITNALEGRKLPVYGDGLNERDWIFVRDHCRALDLVLHAGEPGEIYNIASGRPVSNLEILRRILRMLGKTEELIEFIADRPGHDRRYALDTTKLNAQLGWSPTVSLDEGLRRTLNWYCTHADWVRRAKGGEYMDDQTLDPNREVAVTQ
jgi:dTDP-glucose 4,6-dehydratase